MLCATTTQASASGWLGPGAAAALLLGALLVLPLPLLPSIPVLCLLLVAASLLLFFRRTRWLGIVLLGFSWCGIQASWALEARLPKALEGEDLEVSGWVEGLPVSEARRQRFDFRVDTGVDAASVLDGQRIRLSWYQHAGTVAAGSRWRLTVRLQRPHGGRNPGGFDFERYALQGRLVATGYVRDGEAVLPTGAIGIAALRESLALQIERAVPTPSSRFLRAIGLADTRGLDDRDWDTLRSTGTSHLMAISGLHLGLLAGIAGWFALGIYRLFPRIGLSLPLPQGASLLALSAAAAYAAVAGFGLPTRRALMMLAVALLAILIRRRSGFAQGLSLAILVLIVFDPLAMLGAGFWLSFSGVAWLLWALPRRRASGLVELAKQALQAQVVLGIALLPLTLWFFGQSSLVALPLNLLAIPWLALAVLPATLLGLLLLLIGLPASWPLHWAAWAMDQLWWLLDRTAQLEFVDLQLPPPTLAAFLLALLAAFWLLLPRGVPGKGMALLLAVPLFWPRVEATHEGQLDIWVLDVGQGLSVLIRTREHALLYDAGSAPPGALDHGEAVVVPALRALGIRQLDALIISHADNDHAGGAPSVIAAMHPLRVLAGEPRQLADSRPCTADDAWSWNGVDFRLLHPPAHFPELGNQSSCVLQVSVGSHNLLLPGDVDALIEARLLREYGGGIEADVLVVPHHGSSGSSSPAFVDAVHAQLALVSAGYRSRFGHPRADVVARYRSDGADLRTTAGQGALHVRMSHAAVTVSGDRQDQPHFWSEPVE